MIRTLVLTVAAALLATPAVTAVADDTARPSAIGAERAATAIGNATAAPRTRGADRARKPFKARIDRVGRYRRHMIGVSWRRGCPVPIRDLRIIRMRHHGFDGRVHRGRLMVHENIARKTVRIFRKLYRKDFPIRRMRLIEHFGGSDDRSMARDNSSAFNCRAITGQPGTYSVHSYGKAIDLNTRENPYVNGDTVLPPAGRRFLDRSNVRKGMIVRPGVVVRAFTRRGFDWGGDWTSLKDYQHFEIPQD